MAYWLLKSEPKVFSIDDLKQRGTALWDGVRNYQARNFLRAMQPGDEGFFYHSCCPVPGIVGVLSVAKAAYPDPTQFDPENPYYDVKSPLDVPRWSGVDVRFIEKFPDILSLTALKATPALSGLAVVQRGSRLSIMPVTAVQWKIILKMVRSAS
jgi:predicted RNA-binding protein with PUA-like domain